MHLSTSWRAGSRFAIVCLLVRGSNRVAKEVPTHTASALASLFHSAAEKSERQRHVREWDRSINGSIRRSGWS